MPRPDQRPVHPPAAAWRRVVTLSEPEPGEPEASTTVYLTDTTSASWRPDRDDLATAILAGMGTLGLLHG